MLRVSNFLLLLVFLFKTHLYNLQVTSVACLYLAGQLHVTIVVSQLF